MFTSTMESIMFFQVHPSFVIMFSLSSLHCNQSIHPSTLFCVSFIHGSIIHPFNSVYQYSSIYCFSIIHLPIHLLIPYHIILSSIHPSVLLARTPELFSWFYIIASLYGKKNSFYERVFFTPLSVHKCKMRLVCAALAFGYGRGFCSLCSWLCETLLSVPL